MPHLILPPHGRSALDRARPYLFTALLPLVVLAVGSLIVEYGFRITPYGRQVLHWVEVVAMAGLVLDPFLRLLLARNRLGMLRYRWFEFAVAGGLMLYLAAIGLLRVEHFRNWALIGVQVVIVLMLVARLVEVNQFLAALQVHPALLLVGSFLTLIALGTGFLLLPAATAAGQPATTFTDALFTAVSAVCVTGLTVVDTGTHWSRLGQGAILVLIQMGGLGLMTFASVFALMLWRGMRIRETLVIRDTFTGDLRAEVGRVVVFILLATLMIEAVGAALLMGLWDQAAAAPLSLGERIYTSVFHSVAAFCNAGFGLYPDSLMPFRNTWQVDVIFPTLIITGGIGFSVLYNVMRMIRYNVLGRSRAPLAKRRFILQSSLALVTTLVLLVVGTGLVFLFESLPGRPDAWVCTAYMPATVPAGEAPAAPTASDARGSGATTTGLQTPAAESPLGGTWTERLRSAWFLSATSRTAGFNATDTSRLAAPTKCLTAILMFIGASPGSTGGGIKTVTLAVILCGIWATLRGSPRATLLHRSVPAETVMRALAILTICLAWVAAISVLLAAWGMKPGAHFTFLDCLFETTSAFATVGLSTGTTALLDTPGRLLILATMFFGRIGPLTLFVAMQGRQVRPRYTYPTENVAIS